MKRVTAIVIFQLLIAISNTAQQNGQEKQSLSQIPRESAFVFVAFQPECPLKFENVETLISADGKKPVLRYVLRNTSSKGIRYFSVKFYHQFKIVEWGKYGLSEEVTFGKEDGLGPNLLVHNEVYENINSANFQIVPLSKTFEVLLRSKNTDETRRVIYYGLIKKIIFEDGSSFQEQDNLLNFF